MNALNTLGMCLTALMLVSAPTVADDHEDDSTTSEPITESLDVHCDPVTWVNGQPVVRPECIEQPFP